MSISLRLAVPPSAQPPTLRRRQLNPRARCSNAVAAAIAPVASLRPPRALRGAAPRPADPWWRRRGDAAVCSASAHVSAETMQWASVGAAALLMLAKGTSVHKSFLVPFVALQAPSEVIAWIKGDYGQWTAFLGLLLRLLYFIPGELELPLSTMLFISIAPHQFMNLRGTQDSVILSLMIAAYLAFQHFTGARSVRKAFDRGAIVATLSIICITLIPLLFLF
ncbi:cold-regulated 413 inner membrane protein 1, chloroplastic-like [Lolium rigidum]|uniref:cold-regulated 413 inner membrane protein 1, chloroplastic-like n=1 Tax=Lolium rigidum TaxID=89674 RepID=UPI001F5E18F8|nr:cold-regulated 413 inner membrane protein 1, chloroplastic-like [Lolium rigidum]